MIKVILLQTVFGTIYKYHENLTKATYIHVKLKHTVCRVEKSLSRVVGILAVNSLAVLISCFGFIR